MGSWLNNQLRIFCNNIFVEKYVNLLYGKVDNQYTCKEKRSGKTNT
jgi:hypothetical protein